MSAADRGAAHRHDATGDTPPPVSGSRWFRAGGGQRPLLLAAVLMAVGSFLPWVSTPFGTLGGLDGGGQLTFVASALGIGGSVVGRRTVAALSALGCGGAAVGLAGWQLGRLVRLSVSTEAWGTLLPGQGLVIVLASGLLALVASHRLHRGPA